MYVIVNEYVCTIDKVNNLTRERLLTLSAMYAIYTVHTTIIDQPLNCNFLRQ